MIVDCVYTRQVHLFCCRAETLLHSVWSTMATYTDKLLADGNDNDAKCGREKWYEIFCVEKLCKIKEEKKNGWSRIAQLLSVRTSFTVRQEKFVLIAHCGREHIHLTDSMSIDIVVSNIQYFVCMSNQRQRHVYLSNCLTVCAILLSARVASQIIFFCSFIIFIASACRAVPYRRIRPSATNSRDHVTIERNNDENDRHHSNNKMLVYICWRDWRLLFRGNM